MRSIINPIMIIAPLMALIVFLTSQLFIAQGQVWYAALRQPIIMPPYWVLNYSWLVIYLGTTISFILVWLQLPRTIYFYAIVSLFVLNALALVLWNYLFFVQHSLGAALLDAIIIELSLLLLIGILWKRFIHAALLLVPYAAWMIYVIVLNIWIWFIN